MAPEFSIVVPNFNHGHLLGRCIASATSQVGVELEVIVVDNCSTDDSEATVRAAMQTDDRIRLVRNAVNMGHTYSINRGIDLARGEYLAVLCADDLLAPGALRRVQSVMERFPRVTMVYGRASTDPDAAEQSATSERAKHEVIDGWSWVAECARHGKTPIYSPEVVVRTAAQRAAGPYAEELPISSDMLSFLLVASQGDVCRIDALHGVFDSQPTSFTASTAYLDHLRQQRDAFEAFYRHPLASSGRPLMRLHRCRLGWLGARLAQEALAEGDTATARAAMRFSSSVLKGRSDERPRLSDYLGLVRLAPEASRVTRKNLSSRTEARRSAAPTESIAPDLRSPSRV